MGNLLKDFGVNKTEKLARSSWYLPVVTKTAFKQGALVPLGFVDVIPNSNIICDVDSFVRLALTPYRPFMGDMYFTYGGYFVPYRVLFEKYPEMFGNGKPSEWSDPSEYVLPTTMFNDSANGLTPPTSAVGYDAVVNFSTTGNNASTRVYSRPGHLADYLGLPLQKPTGSITRSEPINIIPFLAYARIWTDFWRDENYQNPDPDLEKAWVLPSGSTSINNFRFALHYANKFHDYFTSLLPNTQKGAVVDLTTPVIGMQQFNLLGNDLVFGTSGGNPLPNGTLVSDSGNMGVVSGSITSNTPVGSTNLGVNISVNELRTAFALQRARERNARTGSRSMNEAMRGIYEANAPAVLNMAEFLGGNTIRLNMMSVPQTGENAGKLGAFSATGANTHAFMKTVNEPGVVMFVGTVRVKHSYTQGIDRFWSKSRRYDFYDPALAHISEQPHYAKEIAFVNSSEAPNDVIGFNEPWIEYSSPVDKITGLLRDSSSADIKAWVLQDTFTTLQSVMPASIYPENGNEVAKVCSDYNSELDSFQFVCDFRANLKITAPKPVYSIPGFVDHLIA